MVRLRADNPVKWLQLTPGPTHRPNRPLLCETGLTSRTWPLASAGGPSAPPPAVPPSLLTLTSSDDATGDSVCGRSRVTDPRLRGGDDAAAPSSAANAERAAMARSATDDKLMPRVVARANTGADDRRTAVPDFDAA